MNPRFPIYVISKGRWKRRQTVKTLNEMGVNFRIVVEPTEYKNYAKHIDTEKIIIAPENFSERGQGSIPVRNFVWEHSIKEGWKRHWILDDNIESMERFNHNMKVACETPTPFYVMEDFVLRYKNIALAGPHYAIFCPAREARPPINLNTRVYSCILIRNDLPFRWRGKYNEDTDLSLRALKAGWVTIVFRAFLIGKRASMTQGGGNENIYDETNDREEFVDSLIEKHPHIVKKVRRFGRFHHHVNYGVFNNGLVRKDRVEIPDRTNNFGMELVRVKNKADYEIERGQTKPISEVNND